jgi:hypothetical protein
VTNCRAGPVQARLLASDDGQVAVAACVVVVIVVRGDVVVGWAAVVEVEGTDVPGLAAVVTVGSVDRVAAGLEAETVGVLVELVHEANTAAADATATGTNTHGALGLAGRSAMSASTSFRRSPIPYAFLAAVLVAAGACGSSNRSSHLGARHLSLPTTATTEASDPGTSVAPVTTNPNTTTSSPPASAAANAPDFSYTASNITAADVPATWHPGCPIPPSQLRMIHLNYWGFDSMAHTGAIVVNALVVNDVVTIFRTLYQKRFPIYEMVPQDRYGGNDNTAAEADDTSGFNCRYAVTNPPSQTWSAHAYGEAIDVNDVQNPYVDGSTIIPPAGAAYLNRAKQQPGMAVPGGLLVEAFAAAGWQWGGRWYPGTDYQHFSKTGG